jgi:pyruvate formate lyase activating enzyme
MDPGPADSIVPTSYWHLLEDGRVQCDLCPRYCKLRDGQRGLCFVRACRDDRVVLTTYGRSSGFCVDPIDLPVLPELGHQQIARDRHAR